MSDFNLLLVDDEEDFLETVSENLALREINVLTANDGREALQIIKRIRIDVVILDTMMPGLGGVETLSEIKKTHPEIEVIMLSGLADIKVAVEAMTKGAFDYLTKPTTIEKLVSRVDDAKERKKLLSRLTGAGDESARV